MSVLVKSNSSVKELDTPNDRRGYTKLYGADGPFWTSTPTLWDNIYNYSRIVIVGKMGSEKSFGNYNFNYDIIPEESIFGASQTILLSNNDMVHALMIIKDCSRSSNKITITGQIRKSNTVNQSISYSAIYGIK